LFGEFTPHSTAVDFDEAGMVRVSLPHCVVPLSWRDFVPSEWERLWVYRRHFDWAPTDSPDRVFLDFGSVLTSASVYLNGRRIGGHLGGYLPFHIELTGRLRPKDNVLAVVVDSRWREDVPPNRPRARRATSIDFYQPGGIPRAVRLRREPHAFLSNVHATASSVLTGAPRLRVVARIDAAEDVPGPVLVDVTLADGATELCQGSKILASAKQGTTDTVLTLSVPKTITLWDTDDPKLYQVHTTLTVGAMPVNSRRTTIGFREARFRRDGFFLNGRRRKLFGLNRHELYPYVGAAMPDRVHRRDAEILKRELNCNMVRCSHYPQSEAFLDACDELGLMVWEEAPGWDYIGDTAWRIRVLRDVHDMIVRDRNHPSIVIWGTRLNETRDNLWLYSRTDDIAERLDPSRPTTGAVNRAPNEVGPVRKSRRGKEVDPYSTTKFTQDVFAYNDYSRPRDPDGAPSLRPPRIDLPYMVSEAVGTLVGPRYYRRTDSEHTQAVQAFLHAAVHNDVASDERYCGLLGWCAFDDPSGWYHSRDGVKWAG
ncbi:MAG: glycoside hydrolase family 2 protein, partial [Sciscionella sp.]